MHRPIVTAEPSASYVLSFPSASRTVRAVLMALTPWW